MLTWFIFLEHAAESALDSLALDPEGRVVQPFQKRSSADLRRLQSKTKTLLVLPAQWGRLVYLAPPRISEQKLRDAMPFALEDHFAESVDHLHFAFDRSFYQDNRYLILAMSKALIRERLEQVSAWALSFDAVTIDYFALEQQQGFIREIGRVVKCSEFNGAISNDLWQAHGSQALANLDWKIFEDSASYYQTIAQGLLSLPYINLCQGGFRQDNQRHHLKRWYQLAGGLAIALMGSFLFLKVTLIFNLSQKNNQLDQQIAEIYRLFFPQAKQVLSPRARVRQFIQAKEAGENHDLWTLFAKLSTVLNAKHQSKTSISLESLSFQSQVLTLNVIADNFSSLEHFEAELQKAMIQVHPLSAITEDRHLLAKIELKR